MSSLTCRTLCVILAMTSFMPRSMTSSAGPGSHLLFYLAVEKELVPQTAELAQRALHLLEIQCRHLQKPTSQCLNQAQQLPPIPALGDFPPGKTLQKEGSKVFTKFLMKEAYINIHKLQRLLEEEDQGGFKPVTDILNSMQSARQHMQTQLESSYKLRIREKKYVGLKNTKWRYTKRPRTKGGNCPEQQQDCLTLADYRLRLLYTMYSRLLRVNHVLDYTVRLSWLTVQHSVVS